MAYVDMFLNDIVVLDLETTGLDPFRAEILELGAIRMDKNFKYKGRLSLKTKPMHIETADPKALQVNGYNEEEWKDAIPGPEGLDRLLRFIQGATTVFTFNVTFDYGVILCNRHAYKLTTPLPRYWLDIMSLSWYHQRDTGGYITLKYSCETLGVRKEREVHRAVNGALAGARVLRRLCDIQTAYKDISAYEALKVLRCDPGGIDGF